MHATMASFLSNLCGSAAVNIINDKARSHEQMIIVQSCSADLRNSAISIRADTRWSTSEILPAGASSPQCPQRRNSDSFMTKRNCIRRLPIPTKCQESSSSTDEILRATETKTRRCPQKRVLEEALKIVSESSTAPCATQQTLGNLPYYECS